MTMIFGLLMLGMVASMFYQKIYFGEHPTVSKVKGYIKGWVYLSLMMLGLMPILAVSEQGVFAIVVASILSLGITGAIFYRIISKRTIALSAEYPDEKLLGAKETFACMGMAIYPFFAMLIFATFITLRVLSISKRR